MVTVGNGIFLAKFLDKKCSRFPDNRELMPALKGKRNQLTTKEANQSRSVTKIRWSVESVHGIIKQKYRLLDHIINKKLLSNVGLYFKIAAFLHNQFGKTLKSDAHL